jgi:hypothetical protein
MVKELSLKDTVYEDVNKNSTVQCLYQPIEAL